MNPTTQIRTIIVAATLALTARIQAAPPAPPDFEPHFTTLCDLAAAKIKDETSAGPYFVDSYAVRALCAAWDMTGRQNYLDACRQWCDRMVKCQEDMTPSGAYYMHYNRKPGETNGDWYAADSSSIGMALLATAPRCSGPAREQYLNSARKFAGLVITNYIKSNGGVSDGLWHQSSNEWWCSSALFASFSFLLYTNTGEQKYLDAALGAVDWLNQWDLTKPQPFPLSQQGPAMIMYVMECYSAGWPFIAQKPSRKEAALAKINWCFNWAANQESIPLNDRQWLTTKGWGMKFGGLPFHEYVFSRYWNTDTKLVQNGDAEMERLAGIVFNSTPELTQLPMFMLMSYAERLDPGAIYKSAR